MVKNHIVLFEPVMPANTGNIARTCAGTNAALHLIHPLGFDTSDKMLKRAGLDYWDKVEIYHHDDLASFLKVLNGRPIYLVTKFADKIYSEVDYAPAGQEDQFFIFGKETTGLPEEFMKEYKESAIRIPMNDEHVRSLNLSNTVSIILFEVLRQQNFSGLEKIHHYQDTDKAKRLDW
ncbi:tRNA (cytidine(34)-2'-O)-methyltransferase [Hutsoniella sourekii]|uniref:tRNA (cytidine(34)-2'-O)-methyltransferase n=1 Tax=Hutsoniella sourekii TaxID=87650 RepID=UPI0004868657|nr:tRNA (cytidine(34)-2'-O)-methyltransferase [Hutsoniella sourekii]